MHGHVVAKPLKILGARHEVGFAVDLHQHADLAARVDVVADQSLGGLALGLFLRGRLALAAQDVNRLVDVAAGFHQRGSAIAKPRAGALA